MSEKSIVRAFVLTCLFLIAINIFVIEMGRVGLWPNEGRGFPLSCPLLFCVIHSVMLIISLLYFVVKRGSVLFVVFELSLLFSVLAYNILAIQSLLYAA